MNKKQKTIPLNVKHTIADLRIRSGLSQIELAKEFGVSKATIGNWEKDSSRIDFNSAQKISKFFRIPIEYIYFGSIKEFREKLKRAIEWKFNSSKE